MFPHNGNRSQHIHHPLHFAGTFALVGQQEMRLCQMKKMIEANDRKLNELLNVMNRQNQDANSELDCAEEMGPKKPKDCIIC